MTRWNLALFTPFGETTRYRHGTKDFIIDLAWGSPSIRARFDGDQGLEGFDHRAQGVTIFSPGDTGTNLRRAEGWNWPMMDRVLVEAEALQRLELKLLIDDTTELDQAFDWLVGTFQLIADIVVPRRTPSLGKGVEWWTLPVQEAC